MICKIIANYLSDALLARNLLLTRQWMLKAIEGAEK